MIKYWRIGTGAFTFIKKYSDLAIKNNFFPGNKIILFEKDNVFTLLNEGVEIEIFNANSTANQYMKVWESFGFILRKYGHEYVISTNLHDIESLIKLSKINLTLPSTDERIEKYRNTIIINILVHSKIINSVDIRDKEIYKGSKPLSIEDVKKSISKYEKELSVDKKFIEDIKEKYDKQF